MVMLVSAYVGCPSINFTWTKVCGSGNVSNDEDIIF